MPGTHILNDPALDAQHEVIFAHIDRLRTMLADEAQEQSVQAALRQLREVLLAHFASEESFMDEHRRQHGILIGLLEQCLDSARPDGEARPPPKEAIGKMADALLRHELRNANIEW
jgi:hemerythrin